MEVFLNRVDGIDDSIISMFLSKRTLTRELEMDIRNETLKCSNMNYDGVTPLGALQDNLSEKMEDWLAKLFKWGVKHYTMLRFIDLSFTVYGLHRAGQDDIDAHAMRMNNRIIRSSTRLADFSRGETSEYYADKIIPTDVALAALGITTPDEIEYNGKTYVRAVNGYVQKGMENNKDVKRGLYMLSIPSNFIFRIQLTEFAHVYKERNINGGANPEVKTSVESMATQVDNATHGFANRDLMFAIKN
ncbi:hypothetical protein [Intestinimonas butyriciproducens]|uniref:hypothetical protein n=1 Tax=Intestinimonas butyriciproducens TaxID=1297617 RepID=UPI0018995C7C|nr:hypothetical protein [Intestinimonas butyriciproducens]MDB7829214.1 hypothetical protein [Intestinimonas butyriciproducens]